MPLLVAVALVLAFLLWRSKRGAAAGPGIMGAPAAPPAAAPLDPGGRPPFFASALDDIGEAIFQYEGGKPSNLNVRNSNPGNLRSGPGMTGRNRGYAVFPDMGDGWDALNGYIVNKTAQHPEWDFYDFFSNYLGQVPGGATVTDQGNSDAYAEFVANYLGVEPTQTVASVLNGG